MTEQTEQAETVNNRLTPENSSASPIRGSLSSLALKRIRSIHFYAYGAGGLASGLALLATWQGPGLSPDSIVYLSTGVNLADGRGLSTLEGDSLTVFPPGLPVLAAAAERVGLAPQQALRLLSVGCAFMAVLLSHVLLRRLQLRASVLAGSTILIAASPALLGLTKMAWTEPPFLVITLLLLEVLGTVWTTGRITSGQCIRLVVLCWCAFLLRYAGVILLPITILVLLLALRPRTARGTIPIIRFALVAIVVPLIWILRNERTDGTWFGPRVPSSDTLIQVLKRIFATVASWILPFAGFIEYPGRLMALAGTLILLTIATMTVRSIRRQTGALGSLDLSRFAIGPALIFVLVYSGWLGAAQLRAAFDPIGNRLLSPIYVPLVLAVAAAVNEFINHKPCRRIGGTRRGHPRLVALSVGFLIAGQIAPAASHVRAGIVDGIGFNSRSWRQSELAELTRSYLNGNDTRIFTNNVPALWAATGAQKIQWAPLVDETRGDNRERKLEAFSSAVACSEAPALLALYATGDPRVLNTTDLLGAVALEKLAEVADGALWTVQPLGPCRLRG